MQELKLLQLLQLADSALPIGALAHSFGLETLIAEENLDVTRLEHFLENYFAEAGFVESVFCKLAFQLGQTGWSTTEFEAEWLRLNRQLSAFKPARESRAASATLGKHFLQLASRLENRPFLHAALQAKCDLHHSASFGLVCGILGLAEEAIVPAFLQQTATSLVSVCQRLLPYGQTGAMQLLWKIKPMLLEVAQRSSAVTNLDELFCFTPLVEIGAMRHSRLQPRLFIS